MDFASLATMARLASAAFDRGAAASSQLPPGWRLYDLGFPTDAQGFSFVAGGGAFIAAANPLTHELAIAFRGAQSTPAGVALFGPHDPVLLAEPFQPVVDAAKLAAAALGDRLLLTGFGLGGTAAEQLYETNRGLATTGAAFGAPGIGAKVEFEDPAFANVFRTSPLGTTLADGHIGVHVAIQDDNGSSANSYTDVRYAERMEAITNSALFSPAPGSQPFITNQSVHFLDVDGPQSVSGRTLTAYSLTIGGPDGDRVDGSTANTGFSADGGGGADSMTGGRGDDQLAGGEGDDTVSGGGADDMIRESAGSNLLRGDDGNDTIIGGSGFDTISGNQGNDVIDGGAGGGDWLVGGQGDDLITSHAGNDLFAGNLGADTLTGGAGEETIRGGQGDDVLQGGSGNDWLSGDRGSDTITGGAGADVFHTFAGAGQDLVTDFHASEGDRVQVDPGTAYSLRQAGPDAVIDLGGGDQMLLANVQLSSLPAGWIFAV